MRKKNQVCDFAMLLTNFFNLSHLLTPELLLYSHSARILEEHEEGSGENNLVQSTEELVRYTDGSSDGELIPKTEDDDEEDDEYNEEQDISQPPTQQLQFKSKDGSIPLTAVCTILQLFLVRSSELLFILLLTAFILCLYTLTPT